MYPKHVIAKRNIAFMVSILLLAYFTPHSFELIKHIEAMIDGEVILIIIICLSALNQLIQVELRATTRNLECKIFQKI